MSAMISILQLMVQKKASDVFLSPHATALIKINGLSVPLNNQVLAASTPINVLGEISSSAQMEELKETGELNTALTIDDLGIFRISAMRQRDTYAVVIRYIALKIPAIDSLNLPPILYILFPVRTPVHSPFTPVILLLSKVFTFVLLFTAFTASVMLFPV